MCLDDCVDELLICATTSVSTTVLSRVQRGSHCACPPAVSVIVTLDV